MNNVIIGSYAVDDLTVKAPGGIIRTLHQLPKRPEEFNRAKKKYGEPTGKTFAEVLEEELAKMRGE